MRTDLPLKLLAQRHAADLLPLLGAERDTVLGVETLELPASQVRLDNLLHLRRPEGQEYLHLIEWQGYRNPLFLWRLLGYVALVAQQRPERPILATVVYVVPEADAGEALEQHLPDGRGWAVRFGAVRLWELDAAAIVAQGPPGLVALAPLMAGMTAALAEQAAQRLVREAEPAEQATLLSVLGALGAPFLGKERSVQMVTRERLPNNEFIQYLIEDELKEAEARGEAKAVQAAEARVAELQAAEARTIAELRAVEAWARSEAAAREAAELRAVLAARAAEAERGEAALQLPDPEPRRAQERALMQQMVGEALLSRFPDAPPRLLLLLPRVLDPARLLALHRAILAAPDLATAEHALADAAR